MLQVLPRSDSESDGRSRLNLLPASVAGWRANDVPLGATEAATANVAGLLRYDDVIHREYRSPKGAFAVYAAYWKPGKIPTQLVASHTPDRCWSSAGWNCEEMRFAEVVRVRRAVAGDRLSVVGQSVTGEAAQSEGQRVGGSEGQKISDSEENTVTFTGSPTTDLPSHRLPITDHRSLITDHRSLKPAQWRRFTSPNGTTQHVLYWHLVGDTIYDYDERLNKVPSPWKWWRDAAKQIFRDPPEQYFIRLSSDRPFGDLADDAGFQEVLAAVGAIGVEVNGDQ